MVMEFRERKEKYSDIISNLNDGLNDLIERCKDKIDEQNKKENPIISSQLPSCGSMQFNEEIPNSDLTADELEALQETSEEEIEDIIDDMSGVDIDDELEELAKQSGGGIGEGQGSITGFTYVPKYTIPEWFDEIEAAVGSMIGEPDKGRAGTDYEEMQTYIEQGVMIVRRPKRMMIQESKEVYVLLDTSGSMSFNQYKGQSFLKLLGGFIPILGEDYTGEYWVCDDCGMRAYQNASKRVPKNEYKLENVTENILKYEGGGGTSFDGAFAKLGAIERKKQEENPDYEMCVIFFSDMEIGYNEFTSYRDLGPSKIIFVTAKNNESELKKHPWIYESDKHKIVLIELEDEK